MRKERVIIAAYRLPYSIKKEKGKVVTKQNSGGLVSAMLSLASKNTDGGKTIWFGFDDNPDNKNEYETEAFSGRHIHIDRELNGLFYGGFCNATIWPLFHYYPFLTRYNEDEFEAYVKANNMMFESMSKEIRDGDFVWIHDYH